MDPPRHAGRVPAAAVYGPGDRRPAVLVTPHQEPPVAQRRHRDLCRCLPSQRLGVAGGERPRYEREGGERREAGGPPDLLLLGQHGSRLSPGQCDQHRVVGHPGLRLYPRPGGSGAPRAGQPGGSDQEGQRVLDGGEARRQQVQVDVEEHHGGGAPDPVQHGLGAHQDRCGGTTGSAPPPRAPATSPTSTPSRAASSSRSRLTPRAGSSAASGRSAAHTTGRVSRAARALEHGFVVAPLCRGATTRATRQLPAVGAGEQPGPPGAVVDAHERPSHRRGARVLQHGAGQSNELLGEQPGTRVGAPAIHTLEGRPAGTFLTGAGACTGSAARRTGGTGEDSTHGTPSRRARSTSTSTAL